MSKKIRNKAFLVCHSSDVILVSEVGLSERELERVLRDLSSLVEEMRSRGGKNPALGEREALASAQTTRPRESTGRFCEVRASWKWARMRMML